MAKVGDLNLNTPVKLDDNRQGRVGKTFVRSAGMPITGLSSVPITKMEPQRFVVIKLASGDDIMIAADTEVETLNA